MTKFRNTSRMAAALIVGCGLAFAGSLTANAQSTSPVASEPGDDPTARITVQLSGGVTLGGGLQIAENQSLDVVALRFENAQIVGEYALDSDKSPAKFLTEFGSKFGTEPQVTAVVIEQPVKENSAARRTLPAVIDTHLPAFEAPPIPQANADAIFERDDLPPAPQAASQSRLLAGEWRPQTVYPSVFRSGASQYVNHYIEWGTNSSPGNIPGSFGMEIQVDLFNSATGTRGSIVPGQICGPNFRDQFVAKNYNWNSWYVSASTGPIANAYPYADLNDLGDSCGKNSMAIGFANPQVIPGGIAGGPFGLTMDTQIDAKVGVVSSSRISGTVQLVNNASCPFDGSIAFTDCMGIPNTAPTTGPIERITLNGARNWTAAPNQCWSSGSYGTVAPTAFACF
jgi:hypothetical protein